MQNNLFKRVLTVTIPQSQVNQILLFRSWPLRSYKTTQLKHSYKFCKDCLKKFQLSLFTIMWRLCGWFIRVFMPEEGRGWGWNCLWTKCIESWLTETSAIFWWQPSYEYTVLFLLWLLLLFLYNFVGERLLSAFRCFRETRDSSWESRPTKNCAIWAPNILLVNNSRRTEVINKIG